MITKEAIENNKIYVSKDVLSNKELVEFWYLANSCQYEYGQASDSRSSQVQRRMVHRIDPEAFVRTTVWGKLEKLFDDPVGLAEAYINYSEFSTTTSPHCDNTEGDPSILICLNQQWDRNWGGYTTFFEGMNTDKVVKTIVPSPGQLIVFNGSMWHYALPIVSFSPYPRFMLAIKIKYM